jgi:hypothetical protein
MLSISILLLAGCPGGGGGSSPMNTPDAPPMQPPPDAPPPPNPDAPLKGYGQTCAAGNQCASGLCVSEQNGPSLCSIPCNIGLANDCRSVDAFCVPIGGNDHACWGSIETLNDTDDAIVSVGDSVTRTLTPLGDADMFQVQLNQLGKIRFTVTPTATIDVKLEAYGVLGSALGSANDVGPSMAEGLETEVQQIGSYMFLVVRNVGTSTGNYTFSVQKIASFSEVGPDSGLDDHGIDPDVHARGTDLHRVE